ncbi:MAG: hypothetical protein HZB16_08095 [Armatimonadetes bacterium]|nr:hypothetical protein [Armatimonadota bacterium]
MPAVRVLAKELAVPLRLGAAVLVWSLWSVAGALSRCRVDSEELFGDLSRLRGVDTLWLVSVALAAAVGLWLTWGETRWGSWALLLTRPVRRRRVVALKLLAGALVVLPVTALPIALLHGWVAWSGQAAWPYDPASAAALWRGWLAVPAWYLACFSTGLPARPTTAWRWLPLAGAAVLARGLGFVERPGWLALAVSAALAVGALLEAERMDWG